MEFIDVDITQGAYVPQYDVTNLSGQVIKTAYSTLEFPFGVYVEELNRYGAANRKLKEKIPVLIEELMNEKGKSKVVDHLLDCQFGWILPVAKIRYESFDTTKNHNLTRVIQ